MKRKPKPIPPDQSPLNSFSEFVERTKGKTLKQGKKLAEDQFAIADEWLEYWRAFPKHKQIQGWAETADYFEDLKFLLAWIDDGGICSPATGYRRQLIERAIAQWERNGKRG